MRGKKISIYDLLVLRAMFVSELFGAIMNEDIKKVKQWLGNYKGEDLIWYDLEEAIEPKRLKEETLKACAEVQRSFENGHTIMGF